MATDETVFVTHPMPVDMAGVRDPGVQSLIMLATSLGWNVLKKHNQPAVITARDGTQKRLPTDTSIRMSVFQTALSTIMVHTEPEVVPTVELIDEIIKATKPPVDHQRRLRLAVGETSAQHRQRLENDKAAEQREEQLTQRLEVPLTETYGETLISGEGVLEPRDWELEAALREGLMVPPAGAADGEEHGQLVKREPYVARYSGTKDSPGQVYTSVTSFERIWEDGYKDYECQICGKAFGTPRAAGSHRQVHTKAGEVERDFRYVPEKWRITRPKRRSKVEFVDELPPEQVDAPASSIEAAPPELLPSADDIVATIIKLVLPRLLADQDALIAALIQERDEARKKLAELEGEFDALVELLTSRRKDRS